MARRKSTKRALLLSALSLLMCVSMLIGSTFAWFTDSVTSGNNIIKSGNLDVELEYKTVKDGKLTDKWVTVKDATKIFDPEALWEPGRVEVVYLKVSNLGTLALKYQLGVNVISETLGKTEGGADIRLSKHLVFKTVILEDESEVGKYDDRKEAIDATAGTTIGLKDYNGTTTALEVGGEDYVALIVYMPESVGNEANYRGTAIPTINLGINLFATQYTVEEDSFDKLYDEEAWVDGMKVYNAADLVSALANEDKVILVNDITATDVIELTKDVAINLNGKTLSASLDVSDDVKISIENGTIANTDKSVSGIQVNDGEVTLENVEISSARHAVRVEGGEVTINGGTYKAAGTSGMTQHALNVSDGATVTINGGTFIGPKGTGADSGAAVNVQANSTVTINGGNFSNGLNNTLASNGTLTVYGGTFDQNPAAYVASGYKAVDNGDGTYTILAGDVVATDSEELADAITNGETKIALPAGNYTLPSVTGKDITLVGVGSETVVDYSNMGNYQEVSGSSFVFKNMTVVNAEAGYPYKGLQHTTSVAYENCHITGTVNLFAPATFTNCTFDSKSAEHNVVTYGSDSVTFTDCDFTYGDRAVNCYAENASERDVKVTFTDCTFTKVAGKDTIGAIETNSIYMNSLNVAINNCSVNEGELVFISSYDSLAGEKSTITVDGKEVYVITIGNPWADNDSDAAILKKALSSDAKDVEIILLEDISVDIGTGWNMGGADTESITIDGNGKTMTLSSTYRSYFNLANAEGKLYLEDMTLTNLHNGGHFFDYTTHFNCDVVAENVVFAKAPLVGAGATAVFTDCQFNQPSTDGYGLWIMSGADVTVNGGVINSERGIKITDEDSAAEHTVLKVSGTKFNNAEKAAILVTTQHGATITVENVDITACTADSTNAVWIDEDRIDYADTVTVTGATCINEP